MDSSPLDHDVCDTRPLVDGARYNYDSTSQSKSSTKKQVSCCSAKCTCTTLVCFVLIVVAGAIVLGLYELGKLPDIDPESADDAIISSGDYVLWNYHYDNFHGILEYSLLFSLPKNAASNYFVMIYMDICNSIPMTFVTFAESIPLNYSLNFTVCPDQTCFFDTYVYEVSSNMSVITYNITNIDYVPNQQNEFEILAFDCIKQSSNGSYTAHSPPIKTAYMRSRDIVFTLNSIEIKKSSYYFFAIKVAKGSSVVVNRFTINQSGIQATYNASHSPAPCKLGQNSRLCSIIIRSNDYCIYLYSEFKTLDNMQMLTSIKISEEKTLQRKVIYPAVGSICLIAAITIVVVVLCKKKRNNFRLCPTSSQNQTIELTPPVETCNDQRNNRNPPQCGHTHFSPNFSRSTAAGSLKPSCMEFDESIHFNENGLFHHFDQSGVTIDVPEGAVDGITTLELSTSQRFPGVRCAAAAENTSYEPISSFVWIDTDRNLSKPAKIYIPHYMQYDETTADDDQEVFLFTNHGKDDAIFQVKKDAHLQLSNAVACVETTQTRSCSACLAKAINADGSPPKRRYHVAVFERSSSDQTEKEVHVCLSYIMPCLKETAKRYKTDGFDQIVCEELKGEISPEGLTISTDLDVPSRGHWRTSRHGQTDKQYMCLNWPWKYEKFGQFTEMITKSNIDIIPQEELAGQSYPPRFKLKFYTEDPQNIIRCSTKLMLHGTDSEEEAFSVTILLGDINIGRQVWGTVAANPDDHEVEQSEKTDDVVIILMLFLANESVFIDSNSYFTFGRQLGLTVPMMSELEFKYPLDYGKCVKQILLEWRRRSLLSPYTDVTDALKGCGYPVLAHCILKKLNITLELHSISWFSMKDLQIDDDDILVAIQELLPIEETGNTLLQSTPSIAELNEVLYPYVCNKLKFFGSKFGLNIAELDVIESDHRITQDRFIALVDTIIQRNQHEMSWQKILEVLHTPLKAYKGIEEIHKYLIAKTIN